VAAFLTALGITPYTPPTLISPAAAADAIKAVLPGRGNTTREALLTVLRDQLVSRSPGAPQLKGFGEAGDDLQPPTGVDKSLAGLVG
jgi:hypothetical protein